MKHLLALSLFVILFCSCEKEELIPNTNDAETVETVGEKLEDKISVATNYGRDALKPIEIYYYNGNSVIEGFYNIHNRNLWIGMIATSRFMNERDWLVYEFHAFTNEEDFNEWGRTNEIHVEEALKVVQRFSEYAGIPSVHHHFLQTGTVQNNYVHYMKNVISDVVGEDMSVSDIFNSTTTVLQDLSNENRATALPFYGAPVLSTDWDNNISGINANNTHFPTVLFEDRFYQNRMNPIIWNQSGQPIRFAGILSGLNNTTQSWF